MPNVEEGAPYLAEAPPAPFRWISPPVAGGVIDRYTNYYVEVPERDLAGYTKAHMVALFEWADRVGVFLKRNSKGSTLRQTSDGFTSRYAPFSQFLVLLSEEQRSYYGSHTLSQAAPGQRVCPECESVEFAGTNICVNGHYLACNNCGAVMGDDVRPRMSAGGLAQCTNCLPVCMVDECEGEAIHNVYDPYGDTEGRWCNEHGVTERCESCDGTSVHSVDDDNEFRLWEPEPDRSIEGARAATLCDPCGERYCTRCSRTGSPLAYNRDVDLNVCQDCRRSLLAGDGNEEWDTEAVSAARLGLPTIEGRDMIRRCGVEIEGAGQYNQLIQGLYEKGLTTHPDRAGYHAGTGLGFAHVERDSSVDWEMVLGPINMADPADVKRLNQAVGLVRKEIREGRASLDLRCGLHIHVDAEKVRIEHAYNLHHIYTYIEDVIYRLGAAKWAIHRSVLNGNGYCKLQPKTRNKVDFVNAFNGDRYMGLSFNNYLGQMLTKCTCGAVKYGLPWDECTCAMKKCTFEFRLFNTTANTKKLHAYLALTQALVAKAMTINVTDPEEQFPALPWNSSRMKDLEAQDAELLRQAWLPRLRFIARELPLTDDERESIRYCVVNSDLASIGEDEINEVFAPAEIVNQEVTA